MKIINNKNNKNMHENSFTARFKEILKEFKDEEKFERWLDALFSPTNNEDENETK